MEKDLPEQSNLSKTIEPRGGKTWKNYLFEFFMLFLAVFLGFFVENQRESYSEQQQELQYIRSMIDDLEKDTAVFNMEIKQRQRVVEIHDSLNYLFSLPIRTQHQQQRLYFLARITPYSITYMKMNDRTYEQMKSSGNLRLINSESISNQISTYYFNAKKIDDGTEETMLRIQEMIHLHGSVFDAKVFREMVDMKKFGFRSPGGYPELITKDERVINDYLMSLHYVVSISSFNEQYLKRLTVEAESLILSLRSEYKLK